MPKPSIRPPKFKLYNPTTNPFQTNSLTTPNGTIALNPVVVGNPATAAIGGTGAFGASNPLAVSSQNPVLKPFKPVQLPNQVTTQIQTPTSTVGSPTIAPLVGTPTPIKPPNVVQPKWEGRGDQAMRELTQSITSVNSDVQMFANNLSLTGKPNFNLLPSELNLMQVKANGMDAQMLAELGYKQDPVSLMWIQQNKQQTPATQGQAGEGNADFMATKFMQYNVENNVAFENQLRWDPIKKKYRKIGQIQEDYGYLPNAMVKPKAKGGGGGQQEQAQPAQRAAPQASSTTNVSGSVGGTFNTATG